MYANSRFAKITAVIVTSIIVIAVFLYVAMDFYVPIIFGWQYKVFNNKPKMLLVWHQGLGEREESARILKVMPKLGVNAKFVCAKLGLSETIFDRHIHDKAKVAAEAMRPDFVLTIERDVPPLKNTLNFVVLDQGIVSYIAKDANDHNAFLNPIHYQFSGLLPTFTEIDVLKEVYENSGKPYYGFRWLPTVQATTYKFQGAKRLFYPGGLLSDPTRSTDKYMHMFKQLDQTGYLDIYGKKDRWQHTPNSYRSFIPIDGESLLAISNAAGVSLVLHSEEHLIAGIPTGRIFESAAANTVIISDRNAFVVENFGDNVLYVDVTQDGDNMFKQIDQHMQWIYAHPAEAQQMAERCHAIFMEKFTLEEQMQRLVQLAMSIS